MFENIINRILGAELRTSTSDRLENAAPSVTVKKDSKPIPEKYKKDVEALRGKYGDTFKTGLSIELTLQEALEIMPRERRRIDAYSGLISCLQKELNITLNLKSQKTKEL
jgi:hypothetical protein